MLASCHFDFINFGDMRWRDVCPYAGLEVKKQVYLADDGDLSRRRDFRCVAFQAS
jgi:hypothetical protein